MLIIGSESQCLSWLVKKKIIDAGWSIYGVEIIEGIFDGEK